MLTREGGVEAAQQSDWSALFTAMAC